jgi:glycyl-tRNA synthetase
MDIEKIAAYCRRRGIVFPNSEIYGGMAGIYDYGPIGTEIKNNIKNLWWGYFVKSKEDVVGIDGAIISHPQVWKASGHVNSFLDYMVTCKKCKITYRADHLIEDKLKITTDGMAQKQLSDHIKKMKCPACNGGFGEVRPYNLMFETTVGPIKEDITYLRPETAQTIFIDFKQTLETSRVKLPFGIAQIGKAFRNEISPRNFLFRLREFEMMEIEYFVHPKKLNDCAVFDDLKKVEVNALTKEMQKKNQKHKKMKMNSLYPKNIKSKWHAYWIGLCYKWFLDLGIQPKNLRLRQHLDEELSHYAKDTWDIDYNYPFGWKELQGIADRTTFDLKQHIQTSKVDMHYFDPDKKEKVIPYVAAEPSLGVDRAFLTFILDAYTEEKVGKEKRVLLKLHPKLASYQVGVFPLVSKDKLPEKARTVFNLLKRQVHCFYDASGSVGRRYRRQDEIGTPLCITIDYDSLKKNDVTIRDRDSMHQVRCKIDILVETVRDLLNKKIELKDVGELIK